MIGEALITSIFTLWLQNGLILDGKISPLNSSFKVLKYKDCEVLFGASKRCQTGSTTQSLHGKSGII